MTDKQVHRFGEVTSVAFLSTAEGVSRFAAHANEDWTIGGKPNGGYLLATMARAVAEVSAHKDVLAASAHYLRSPEPGDVEITVEVLRAGRTASQLRARLDQGGKTCVEALMTLGTLDIDAKPYWDGGLPKIEVAQPDACLRIEGKAPNGLVLPMMDHVDLRLDPVCLGFGVGQPSGRGELQGWLGLGHSDDFDPISLLFAVDAYPPATFDVEVTGWVPTLELSVYVRALPAPGPVTVLQKANLVDGGRVDEVCYVWDSTGRLVAQATQPAHRA